MRIAVLILALLYAGSAVAAPPEPVGIVAVVNDQVISSVDVNNRIQLAMGLAGIADTQESRARIAPQILRQLIDEKLQMQDAAQAGITISDAKLQEGIARIEKQSGKPAGSVEQFLESKGLSKVSFYAQVRAQLAWSEIVLRKVRPAIRISDQEVARYVKHSTASSAAGAQEVLIATIALPVDTPANEPNIRTLAEKLVADIRAGASFEGVAAQFSSGTGGTKATDPFWVEVSQIDPSIAAALSKAAKGSVTDPIRTPAGYQIVKLMDVREAPAVIAKDAASEPRAELAYKQILMTLKPDAQKKEAELLLQLAKEVQKAPGKCSDTSFAGVGDLSDLDFKITLMRSVSSDLSGKLRALLMGMKVGEASEPVITPQGIWIFMLCERIEMPPAANAPASVADDTARQAIYEEKLDLEAQKYLRNLRREAFIEIRH